MTEGTKALSILELSGSDGHDDSVAGYIRVQVHLEDGSPLGVSQRFALKLTAAEAEKLGADFMFLADSLAR